MEAIWRGSTWPSILSTLSMFTSPPSLPPSSSLETVERAIQRTIVNPHGRSPGRSKIHLKTLDIARLLRATPESPPSPPSSSPSSSLKIPRNLDYFVDRTFSSYITHIESYIYILFHACIFIFKSKGRRRLPWMLINFVISRVWIKHDILRFLTSPAIFTVFVKPRVFRRRWREGEGGEGEGRARWWSLKINYQSRLWVKPRRFVFVQRNIMEVTVSCTEIASEYSLS